MKKLFTNIYFLLFIALVFWASAFVGIRIGLSSYSPGALALFRFMIASLFLLPIFCKYYRNNHLAIKDTLRIMLIGIIGIGIYNISLNYGEITTTSSIASFIMSQAPVFIILMAVFFLKEKLNLLGWIAVAISFLGVSLIILSKWNSLQIDKGIFYVLLTALTGALYTILQKPLLRKINSLELVIFFIWSGTLIMMVFLPQLLHEIPKATMLSTTTVIYMGVFPGAISYIIWSKVLTKMDASQAAGYLYIVPILTTLMGFIRGEMPLFLSLLGGVVALLGAILLHYSKKPSRI